MATPEGPKVKSPKKRLNLGFPFNLLATPEAAAGRIIKNLCHFSLFYTLVPWVRLSISLVPQHKPSLLLRMATTNIGNQYLIDATADAESHLHTQIMTTVELILTEAGIHLAATLGIGVPVILVRVVFWRDDLFVNEEASASAPSELAPLVDDV